MPEKTLCGGQDARRGDFQARAVCPCDPRKIWVYGLFQSNRWRLFGRNASKKSEVIAAALEQLQTRDVSRAVMVGDRKYDVLGAKEVGLPCIGLDSGFSEIGELEAAGAVFVVKNFAQLEKLLLG